MKSTSKEKNVFFFHPLVRESLVNEEPGKKDFFLCYASSSSLAPFVSLLKKEKNNNFVVYGFGEKPSEKNIVYKNFSKKEWSQDIKNCKGLICHGGLLSISEAVILKKPIFVFATKDWFERFHNGKMVQDLGFGKIQGIPTEAGINEFLSKNEFYSENLVKKNIKPANKEFFEKLEELIEISKK